MMASHSESEEEQFFDTLDEITSVSGSTSDCSDECCCSSGCLKCVLNGFGYDFWTTTPESALQRRQRFMKWMGLRLDHDRVDKEEVSDTSCNEIKLDFDRINEDSGAMLRTSNSNDPFLSDQSSMSCYSTEDAELIGEDASEQTFQCKTKNLEVGSELVVDETSHNGTHGKLLVVGSNRLIGVEENQRARVSSSSLQPLSDMEIGESNLAAMKNKVKSVWLRKLAIKARTSRKGEASTGSTFNSEIGAKFRRVRVHQYRKKSNVLSCLYAGQELPAHEGSILTMKFSPDGQYLASAGEDGIVRVWRVIEVERPKKILTPLDTSNDKTGKMKRFRKSSELAGIIFPPKVFWIMEEPLHEFHGHAGDVLALSWSKNGCLLSSCVDKTVRLWQLGHNQCLGVFSHNNYVTCVEFNPVNENYFISGSIDGKVRIWDVHACRVVYWIDIREIVTAVCYYPSGKGGIVGSMDGSCRFYDIIDQQLQLDTQIFLQGKKKSPSKRITGFQFSPSDPTKVLVTSADSQVRVLCGVDVVFKFKGPRTSGSQMNASFTEDGKHIVSACEDSNVHVWGNIHQEKASSRSKKIVACESFYSHSALIDIPWCGMKTLSGSRSNPSAGVDDLAGGRLSETVQGNQNLLNGVPSYPRDCFSLSCGLFLESLPKGNATWPEEKLPISSLVEASPTMCRSEDNFMKSASLNTFSSHIWGLVIVTAGQDGRIRTYHNYGLHTGL